MKNLVIQYYIDIQKYSQPEYNNLKPNPIEEYSRYSFEQYCEKYGMDYIRITEPKINFKHPTWERFDLWIDRSWWDKYDQIMYVDSDVVVVPWAPNIFDLYKDLETFKFVRYPKYRDFPVEDHRKENTNTIFKDIDPNIIQQKRFQTGVFIVTKESTQHMLSDIERYSECPVDDGQFLNWAVMHSNVKYTEMDKAFNVKTHGQKTKETIHFMHCAGGKKHHSDNKIWKIMRKFYPDVKPNLTSLLD